MLLLDSLYINNSGGKVLLDYLIERLHLSGTDVFYLLDERCHGSYPFLPASKTIYLKASLKNRHRFYKQHQEQFTHVLCFANIPPTLRLNAAVYTYFHNLLLLEQPAAYPFKSKIKAFLKGLVIKRYKQNTDHFIVQSENVQKTLLRSLKLPESKCLILPFYKQMQTDKPFHQKENGFIYISNGNAHKNHSTLLAAWEILHKRMNISLPLHLTITEEYPALIQEVERYKTKGLPIFNHGRVNVKDLYSNYKYSIYPSLIESFGLGLIEAVDSQVEVLASDLPYVHAVIEPAGTFDPYSPESIALAVKKITEKNIPIFVSKRKTSDQIDQLIGLFLKK